MKFNQLIVVMENKSGGCYQVILSEDEKGYVQNLISQLHKGIIKVARPKLPFTLGKKPPVGRLRAGS